MAPFLWPKLWRETESAFRGGSRKGYVETNQKEAGMNDINAGGG